MKMQPTATQTNPRTKARHPRLRMTVNRTNLSCTQHAFRGYQVQDALNRRQRRSPVINRRLADDPRLPTYNRLAYEHFHIYNRRTTTITQPGTFPGSSLPISCFAPGTKVWTLTGRMPIGQIKIGDRVLAQNVESGELAYKPVLAVTTRPPGTRMKIGLGPDASCPRPPIRFGSWAKAGR